MNQTDRELVLSKAKQLSKLFNQGSLLSMPEIYLRRWQSFIQNGYIKITNGKAEVVEENIK